MAFLSPIDAGRVPLLHDARYAPRPPQQVPIPRQLPPVSPSFSWDAFTVIFSGIWVFLTADSLYSLAGGFFTDATWEGHVVHGAGVASMVTGAVHWADSVGMISLGSFAALAEALGFGATGIITFFEAMNSCRTLLSLDAGAPGACEQMTLALLQLGYRVTMLAWSILGIASFIAGTALVPTLSSILFFTSFLFFLSSIVYQQRLERRAAT